MAMKFITNNPSIPGATWTYSHTQLNLFRICPRRYYEKYVIGPGDDEEMSPIVEFSKLLVHEPIEARANGVPWGLKQYQEAEAKFMKTTGLKPDFTYFGADLAIDIQRMLSDTPLANPKDVQFVEYGKTVGLSDPWGSDEVRWQFQSKPDIVRPSMTIDLKVTESWKPKPLMSFADQFMGQAIVFGRPVFCRIVFQILKGKAQSPIVDELPVDEVLAEEWVRNTVRTIKWIEHCREIGYWPQQEQGCEAYGRPCPFKGSCSYGFTDQKRRIQDA